MAFDRHHHHYRLPLPLLSGCKVTDMLFDTYTGKDLSIRLYPYDHLGFKSKLWTYKVTSSQGIGCLKLLHDLRGEIADDLYFTLHFESR